MRRRLERSEINACVESTKRQCSEPKDIPLRLAETKTPTTPVEKAIQHLQNSRNMNIVGNLTHEDKFEMGLVLEQSGTIDELCCRGSGQTLPRKADLGST